LWRLRRPALGRRPGCQVVARPWSPAARGRRADRLAGRRRGPVRLAIAAVCRAGAAGTLPPRLAAAGPGLVGVRGLSLPDLVAPDSPPRSLLDPPAAGPGDAGGDRGRRDPAPGMVDPARGRIG